MRYAPFCDENGKLVGECTVLRMATDRCMAVTAVDSDLDHFGTVADGLSVEIEPLTTSCRSLASAALARASCSRASQTADVARLGYFRFWPEQVEVGGVPCWVSRTGYSGELGYVCRPTGPSSSGTRLSAPARGRMGWRQSRRSGSSPGFFFGRDYIHRDEPVRRRPRQARPARQGRVSREAGARRRGREPVQPIRHARRGRTGPRLRRRRDEERHAGRHGDEPHAQAPPSARSSA